MVLNLEVFLTFAIGIESVIRYSCKLLSNRKALFLTCKWRISYLMTNEEDLFTLKV